MAIYEILRGYEISVFVNFNHIVKQIIEISPNINFDFVKIIFTIKI